MDPRERGRLRTSWTYGGQGPTRPMGPPAAARGAAR